MEKTVPIEAMYEEAQNEDDESSEMNAKITDTEQSSAINSTY